MINKYLCLLLLLTASNISKAQISATTATGRQVILYNDGTWKYGADSSVNSTHPDSIKINSGKFSKSASAAFLVKSSVNNAGIFVDPDKWTVKTHRDNETNPEYRFSAKSGNGYAILQTEKTQLGLENMPYIAITNAQKAAIDARLTKQEYRTVNDRKILYLEMAGTIRGIKFMYMGYYFSNEKGTTQLLCYTTAEQYNAASKELEAFLNGFVVIN